MKKTNYRELSQVPPVQIFSVICSEKCFLFSRAIWDSQALHRKGLYLSGFSVPQYFDSLAGFIPTFFLESFLVEYYPLTVLGGW